MTNVDGTMFLSHSDKSHVLSMATRNHSTLHRHDDRITQSHRHDNRITQSLSLPDSLSCRSSPVDEDTCINAVIRQCADMGSNTLVLESIKILLLKYLYLTLMK